jgi:molecular chaperone HtpG
MAQIGIKFETSSMLNMFSNSLYDTPLVFLRENLQNAYDAVLMRKHQDATYNDWRIDIKVEDSSIIIVDNGIGMNRKELEENYWTAGRSGKNTPEAKAAGVVGTFGIGALANFGVCQTLEIYSRRYNEADGIYCKAVKDKYDEIFVEDNKRDLPQGTKVIATLQPQKTISATTALNYVTPYVEYLPIPVFFNGTLVSQKTYIPSDVQSFKSTSNDVNGINISYLYSLSIIRQGAIGVKVYIKGIHYGDESWQGDALLDTTKPVLFALRSGFGLSAVPIGSTFKLGGLVNLSMLVPTAGREAINQECINKVQRLMVDIERIIADEVSSQDICDNYSSFISYINTHYTHQLARNITIQQYDGTSNERIKLGKIIDAPHNYRFYDGTNPSYLSSFAGSEYSIVIVSREYPRREVQRRCLHDLGVEQLVEKIEVQKDYEFSELPDGSFSLIMALQRVIEKDYFIPNNAVYFSDITLGARIVVERRTDGKVCVHIAKDSAEIKSLLDIYRQSYSVFESMVKNYVLSYIYQQIQPYIPSSSKEGIEQVCNMLKQNQESFEIGIEDYSYIDKSYELYKENKISADELADRINRNAKVSRQQINQDNVADVNTVLQTTETPAQESIDQTVAEQQPINKLEPLPSIMRQNKTTAAKLLETKEDSPMLHGYKRFVAVTPNMYDQNLYFFFNPHTTRVLWSMHRIIYIFSLRDGSYTLYYDMELKKHIASELTGGEEMYTTTIITKDKLFIPIPPPLYDYFTIDGEPLKFNIRFNGIEGKEDKN